jgi:hypothetical protein
VLQVVEQGQEEQKTQNLEILQFLEEPFLHSLPNQRKVKALSRDDEAAEYLVLRIWPFLFHTICLKSRSFKFCLSQNNIRNLLEGRMQ